MTTADAKSITAEMHNAHREFCLEYGSIEYAVWLRNVVRAEEEAIERNRAYHARELQAHFSDAE
jgi:hypothetical protein